MEKRQDGTGSLALALGLVGAWGLGMFLLAKDRGALDGLGEDAPRPVRVAARRQPASVPVLVSASAEATEEGPQNRRFLARRFYGTFVLAQQGAQAMERAQRKSGGRVRDESASLRETLRATARKSLKAARDLDPGYVKSLCARPNAPSCEV